MALAFQAGFCSLGRISHIGCKTDDDSPGLDTVGVSMALGRAVDIEVLMTFHLHGGVDYDADKFSKNIIALCSEFTPAARLVR